jgi:hypothetical protein
MLSLVKLLTSLVVVACPTPNPVFEEMLLNKEKWNVRSFGERPDNCCF